MTGLGASTLKEHYGIRRWEYYQADAWNWNARKFYDIWVGSSYRYYSPSLHHENFTNNVFRIIKNRPVLPR
ncbi:hypothetical protein [Ascidiimonas sp. W6]|uniref:hypothetical protein n=1 Tax=Ascidiimonas meishanensis TaxID=3128903 RepID=UPI0030ED66EF